MDEIITTEIDPASYRFFQAQEIPSIESHYWIKSIGKTPNQVLKEIHDTLSVRLSYQQNADLCLQVQFILEKYHSTGDKSILFKDMKERIDGFLLTEKYESQKEIGEIIQSEVSEAQFNIQYFAPKAIYPNLKH